MSLTKPNAVKAGATFGIVSPASAPIVEHVRAGAAALERQGYTTKIFPHALDRGPLYYAGTAADRAGDLHAAFADDDVDAVLCTRGGWGAAELLPLLDAELIRGNPKPFLGFSDVTTLHIWMRNEVERVSFQAPMAAAGWAKDGGVDLTSWSAALEGAESWAFGAESGLRVLRAGVAEGELHGGCLSIVAESLGTPWAARARGGVLMLEDVGVKPYQWDRMLVHLRQAGILENVTGVVFGDMAECVSAQELPLLEASLLYALRDFNGAIAIGLRSGHVAAANITLPFGVRARLDCSDAGAPKLTFLEAATAVE